jgi:hypothetical protein
MTADAVLQTANGTGLVRNELVVDTVKKKVYIPLAPGSNAKLFKPEFVHLPGISVLPGKKVDFSKGAVPYYVTIIGHKPVLYVLSTTESSFPKAFSAFSAVIKCASQFSRM